VFDRTLVDFGCVGEICGDVQGVGDLLSEAGCNRFGERRTLAWPSPPPCTVTAARPRSMSLHQRRDHLGGNGCLCGHVGSCYALSRVRWELRPSANSAGARGCLQR
jgi:hypothetical protein